MNSDLWPIYLTVAFVALAAAADLGHGWWTHRKRRPDSLSDHYRNLERHKRSFMERHEHEVQG